jgi:hypothetical protein
MSPSSRLHGSATGARFSSIDRIRTKISDLTEDEKDKLLFEVFDTLLRDAKQCSTYPQPQVVANQEECRLKAKRKPPDQQTNKTAEKPGRHACS